MVDLDKVNDLKIRFCTMGADFLFIVVREEMVFYSSHACLHNELASQERNFLDQLFIGRLEMLNTLDPFTKFSVQR